MRITKGQLRRIIREVTETGSWDDALFAATDEVDLMYALEASPAPELAELVVTGPDDWGLRRTRKIMDRELANMAPNYRWHHPENDAPKLQVLRMTIERIDELLEA